MKAKEEFKVLIPVTLDTDNYRLKYHTKDNSIPEYDKRILDDELRGWLKERNITYSLGFHEGAIENTCFVHCYNWFVIFTNKNDAMLFKLTWC